jgi:hypothetical protein
MPQVELTLEKLCLTINLRREAIVAPPRGTAEDST